MATTRSTPTPLATRRRRCSRRAGRKRMSALRRRTRPAGALPGVVDEPSGPGSSADESVTTNRQRTSALVHPNTGLSEPSGARATRDDPLSRPPFRPTPVEGSEVENPRELGGMSVDSKPSSQESPKPVRVNIERTNAFVPTSTSTSIYTSSSSSPSLSSSSSSPDLQNLTEIKSSQDQRGERRPFPRRQDVARGRDASPVGQLVGAVRSVRAGVPAQHGPHSASASSRGSSSGRR
jgi:hypothetical protein